MASLFVHLPFEKKKSVKCPITSSGKQRPFPLPTLRSEYQPIQIESFVRLRFNAMFPRDSLVLCNTGPSSSPGMGQHDPIHLGLREGRSLGSRWACKEGGPPFPGVRGSPFLSSRACRVGSGHRAHSLGPSNWKTEKETQIYFVFLKFGIFFLQYLTHSIT